MDDNHSTLQLSNHGISRPSGPRKRDSLPRMKALDNSFIASTNMAPKKPKQKTANDSMHSSPETSPNSSMPSPRIPGPELRHRRNTQDSSIRDPTFSDLENSVTESNLSNSVISDETTDSTNNSSQSSEYPPERNEIIIEKSLRPDNKKTVKIDKNSPDNKLIIIPILFALVILGSWGLVRLMKNYTEKESSFNLKSSIRELRTLFPSQDKAIWSNFGSGIADVESKNHTPAIFLLLASDNETTSCLAKRVAEIARSALHGEGDVILTAEQLKNDINQVFDVMERQIKQTKAVVVFDILNIHPEAMRAFHDICDEYSSLINEAVYLLTMRPCKLYDESANNLVSCAEQQLKTKFSNHIQKDTLDALIIRITTGAVLDIKAEEKIPCSEKESA